MKETRRKPVKRAVLSPSEKREREYDKWYQRQFGPHDPDLTPKQRKDSVRLIGEIDARDATLRKLWDVNRRLKIDLKVAKFELQELEDHLSEKHQCDFVCRHVTMIDPIDTSLVSLAPNAASPYIYHAWMHTDALIDAEARAAFPNIFDDARPRQFVAVDSIPEQQMGWWWRAPWATWLKLWKKK